MKPSSELQGFRSEQLESVIHSLAVKIAEQQVELNLPNKEIIAKFVATLHSALFPNSITCRKDNEVSSFKEQLINADKLLDESLASFCFISEDRINIRQEFFGSLSSVYERLNQDCTALFSTDPAAKSKMEIIVSYPGFKAVSFFRYAHVLNKLGVNLIPRIITEFAHAETGIDIHPGAVIGDGFAIDHGTGVVIGETANIGNNVSIYQGVTLGALSVAKSKQSTKRHPTIEDRVKIYANATILGGNTVIGHDSVIGGNAWVTSSVKPFSKVYREVN